MTTTDRHYTTLHLYVRRRLISNAYIQRSCWAPPDPCSPLPAALYSAVTIRRGIIRHTNETQGRTRPSSDTRTEVGSHQAPNPSLHR